MTALSGIAFNIGSLGAAGLLQSGAGRSEAGTDSGGGGTPGALTELWSNAGDDSMVSMAQGMANAFRMRLLERLAATPDTLSETLAVLAANSPTGRPEHFLQVVGWTLVFLVIGHLLARYLVQRPLLRPLYARRMVAAPQGTAEKLPLLLLRAALGGVTLLLSILVAFMIGAATFPPPENDAAEKTLLILFAAWSVGFGLVLLWRLILAPNLDNYRIPPMSQAEARRLFRWLAPGSVFAVAVHAYCIWMYELGLSQNVHAVIVSGLTLLAVGVTIATLILNRGAITRALLCGGDCSTATGPARIVGTLWLPLAIVYVATSWGELTYRLIMGNALGMPPVLGFYLVIASILAVHGLLLYVIDRHFRRRDARAAAASAEVVPIFAPIEVDADAAPALVQEPATRGAGIRTYEDLANRVAGYIAAAVGAFALLWIWEAQKLPAMREAMSHAVTLLTVLLLGHVAYHAARIAIDSRIDREGGTPAAPVAGDEGGAAGASRLATLLPLIRTVVLALIVAIAGAMLLVELGVNLGPLFAGAGIIGIAIGFGAQYLIRDIFAGVFFLVDDAFRRGEYIEIGDVKGTVEKISIRSFQLRHHLGPLQTIPFGEIKTITNRSRDWVIMKLPLRVTYDTDVERVRKLVKKLGQDLLEDPEIGDQFLEPLKSQGVIEMQDSAMIIRVKFTTKPGDQWTIRQRVYQEVRELFQREGIKFAHREVTVRVAEDGRPLTPGQQEAIKAAALDFEADAGGAPERRPAAADAR